MPWCVISDRKLLSRAEQAQSGEMIGIEFADGEVSALVSGTGAATPRPKAASRTKSNKTPEPGQGSLF
jgi:exodeoxyribonuclease VII large subunit